MPKKFKIICRNSKLSLIQGNIAKTMIEKTDPEIEIEIVSKPSRGDLDTITPLYLMGDKNIFTQDIEDVLRAKNADFAVHSLKDVSAEKFEDLSLKLAVFDRDLMHDVVIFRKNIADILRGGQILKLGTSSLRRQELVPPFLKKYFLQVIENQSITIETCPIRGNVDTRLRKLLEGEYDAIILAAAGLNRLCRHDIAVRTLLNSCDMLLLPLMECPSAAGQGALLIECLSENADASAILEKIHDKNIAKNLQIERDEARKWGAGCHQKFGVVSFETRGGNLTRVGGLDTEGGVLDALYSDILLSDFDFRVKKLFSATDFMRDFFDYEYPIVSENDLFMLKNAEMIFVAHHRAASDKRVLEILKTKKVWASGTKTWRELLKMGINVQGCADGLGFHFLDNVFESALFDIPKSHILILTNTKSVKNWQEEGIAALGTYSLIPCINKDLKTSFAAAELCFWTNFEQYLVAKPYLNFSVIHACPSGKTKDLFLNEGINPVVFPSIKAFLHWRKAFSEI